MFAPASNSAPKPMSQESRLENFAAPLLQAVADGVENTLRDGFR